ncbi:hypothetical protein DPMN_177568 [Dreissena polymorpha]|uniref:Uncharacterized protein n=1 Tax=Dreissena polymorpha TaxID=45954 RepID=A0A9D4IKN4_DREPO|nr:hypothetical protein DPMN_177568 [Dreissena polymorpha]
MDEGCGRQLIRTRHRNKWPSWRRRNAAETAPVPEPASAHVPGSKTEAELAAALPSKRKRADDEIVDFCDIFRTTDGLPRGHNVGKHEALACNANEILPKKSLSRMDNIQRIHILPRQTNDDVSVYVSASLTQRHVFAVANTLILHYCLKPPELIFLIKIQLSHLTRIDQYSSDTF